METWGRPDVWWRCTGAEPDFAAWLADRCAVECDHLVAVAAVGRDRDGRLVAAAAELSGVRLPDGLDRIGVLTAGVAVTLSLPLLDVAALSSRGALVLGDVCIDDVIVDDAGAVVVVDRPPATRSAAPTGIATGADALVLAVRTVWDRVDPREPGVAAVQEACSAAQDASADAVAVLASVVRAAAAPRPVRWEPPATAYTFPDEDADVPDDVLGRAVARLSDVVQHGVPVGGRRFPLRTAATAVVVLVGLVVAGLTATGDPDRRTTTAPPPTRGGGAVVSVGSVPDGAVPEGAVPEGLSTRGSGRSCPPRGGSSPRRGTGTRPHRR